MGAVTWAGMSCSIAAWGSEFAFQEVKTLGRQNKPNSAALRLQPSGRLGLYWTIAKRKIWRCAERGPIKKGIRWRRDFPPPLLRTCQ